MSMMITEYVCVVLGVCRGACLDWCLSVCVAGASTDILWHGWGCGKVCSVAVAMDIYLVGRRRQTTEYINLQLHTITINHFLSISFSISDTFSLERQTISFENIHTYLCTSIFRKTTTNFHINIKFWKKSKTFYWKSQEYDNVLPHFLCLIIFIGESKCLYV